MSRRGGFWRRFPAALMARRNLSRTKLRSALAALGIVIGVLAIASLGLFGATIQQAAAGSLGDIGNELIVSPAFDQGVQEITERDVREIERVAGDAAVVPVKQRTQVVSYGDQRVVASVYGMSSPGAVYAAREGTIPDRMRSGVVVGADMADRLGVRPGNSIRLGNRTYRVQAVLEPQTGFSPISVDTAVIVPPSAFQSDGYSQVVVSAESGEAANRTAVRIREAVNDRDERVSIFELSSITDQISQFFGALNAFLIGIGSISLVVAGVSILNVMLMSTIERREEIGVLRAVGYQRRDVLKILLTESLLLGLIGGLVGSVLSLGAGLVVSQFILGSPTASLSPGTLSYVVVAFVFGVVTSLVSGFYPAWKAANEQPVDALRH